MLLTRSATKLRHQKTPRPADAAPVHCKTPQLIRRFREKRTYQEEETVLEDKKSSAASSGRRQRRAGTTANTVSLSTLFKSQRRKKSGEHSQKRKENEPQRTKRPAAAAATRRHLLQRQHLSSKIVFRAAIRQNALTTNIQKPSSKQDKWNANLRDEKLPDERRRGAPATKR